MDNYNIKLLSNNEDNKLNQYITKLTKVLTYEEPERVEEIELFWRKWFNDAIKGDKLTIIAEELSFNNAVGVVRFWKTPYCENQWFIEGLEVISPKRKSGIGIAMVKEGLKVLKGRGIDEINVNIRNDNFPSINLHKKLGFKKVSEGCNNSLGDYREKLNRYILELNKYMTKEFEKQYMNEYWKLQKMQFDNYFEDKNYDLNEIDSEIYNIVKAFKNKIYSTNRNEHIANLIISRDLIDKNPDTAKLRNKIDNFDNYNEGLSEEIKKDRNKYKLILSSRMKNDVLQLMNIRNKLAKQYGYISYPELVLSAEEIDKSNLINILEKYVEYNLPKVKELINKYNMTWETWFDDLSRIGASSKNYDAVKIVHQLLEELGLQEVYKKTDINFREKGYTGYAAEIEPENIKVIIAPVKSLYELKVLFHEIGHAIAYALNKETHLLRILPASYDEAVAVVMEYIAPLILLDKEEQQTMLEISTLEYVRCAISALYEFELWENPDKAEELYMKHYGKLGMNIETPSIWAYDSFRSIDPVYIHNYVIGAALAEKTIEYFKNQYGDNYKQWGNYLVKNIYCDGRKRAFREKVKNIINI